MFSLRLQNCIHLYNCIKDGLFYLVNVVQCCLFVCVYGLYDTYIICSLKTPRDVQLIRLSSASQIIILQQAHLKEKLMTNEILLNG